MEDTFHNILMTIYLLLFIVQHNSHQSYPLESQVIPPLETLEIIRRLCGQIALNSSAGLNYILDEEEDTCIFFLNLNGPTFFTLISVDLGLFS